MKKEDSYSTDSYGKWNAIPGELPSKFTIHNTYGSGCDVYQNVLVYKSCTIINVLLRSKHRTVQLTAWK